MTTFVAHPTKPEIAASTGVVLSRESASQLLDAYNSVLSPMPMTPWPAFLPPVQETIANRASLHSALLQCKNPATAERHAKPRETIMKSSISGVKA